MSDLEALTSLPKSPCERRKRMLLQALTPVPHRIKGLTGGEVDTAPLIWRGEYERVIDLYFVHSQYRLAPATNNLGCAYAHCGDLDEARRWFRSSAQRDPNGEVGAIARRNLRLVLLAMAAAR